MSRVNLIPDFREGAASFVPLEAPWLFHHHMCDQQSLQTLIDSLWTLMTVHSVDSLCALTIQNSYNSKQPHR